MYGINHNRSTSFLVHIFISTPRVILPSNPNSYFLASCVNADHRSIQECCKHSPLCAYIYGLFLPFFSTQFPVFETLPHPPGGFTPQPKPIAINIFRGAQAPAPPFPRSTQGGPGRLVRHWRTDTLPAPRAMSPFQKAQYYSYYCYLIIIYYYIIFIILLLLFFTVLLHHTRLRSVVSKTSKVARQLDLLVALVVLVLPRISSFCGTEVLGCASDDVGSRELKVS